uniref:Protein transport protein Sec31A n=1 Tax=Corethrella appendiculata TaxID=1370023 RepID=U5EYS2_9DIPT
MKIKELQKAVNTSWSPCQQESIMLAAGTAAQQLDSSFGNNNTTLEIYSINLNEPGYDLKLMGTQQSAQRFHKIIWSPYGLQQNTANAGLIVGGCESGFIQIYNAAKLLNSEDSLIAQQNKHSGPVRALDFNPFQTNLLASASSESEIFIWDLNNTTTPMTPGTKTQPFEDVHDVAWNRQVQHILVSAFSSRSIVWDLRKNEPIIKLSDTQSRVRWRCTQWHPDVATQLWLASEEDQAPLIQLWDLRYATAPAQSFQIHQRGVLGLTWCPKDTSIMASCGKDNKIFCWNPSSNDPNGEILSELATTNQWYSDIQWCPRNPALIAASSFDGNVSIYSIFGGTQQQIQTSSKIADSFPGMDTFNQAPIHQQQQQTLVTSCDLKRAPNWLKRSAGATFGFGGKLITFNNNGKSVTINQIVTDQSLVDRSNQLESVLEQGNCIEYCRQKADQTTDPHTRFIWYFLKANFEENPHAEMLNLLGYQKDDIQNKFKKYTTETASNENKPEINSVDNLTEKMGGLTPILNNKELFEFIAASKKQQLTNGETVQENKNKEDSISFKIRTGNDSDGLICEALLTGNIEAAVELCMQSGRTTEALILAISGGSELLARVQYRFLKENNSYLSNLISALVTEDWSGVVSQCTVDSWKEALVAILTHSKHQTSIQCERLGERLQIEANGDSEIAKNAILCYICAGSTERLVEAWNISKGGIINASMAPFDESNDKNNNNNRDLQDLIEVVMILQKGLEKQGRNVEPTGKLADLLSQYAGLLAAQGSLSSALTYLGASLDPEMIELRDRLYYALGHKQLNAPVSTARSNSYYQQQQQQMPQQTTGLSRYNQPRSSLTNPSIPPMSNIPFNPSSVATTNTYFNSNTNAPQLPPTQPVWNTSPFGVQPQVFNPVQQTPNVTAPPLPPTAADLQHPPRPSSVGSQSGAGSALSRAKYVVDPSVSSGPSYGQTPGIYNPNIYTQQPQSQPQPYQFNTQPIAGNAPTQFTPAPLSQPVSFLSGVPPVEMGQQALPLQQQQNLPPPPQMQKNPTPPPGWNDPPALKTQRPSIKKDTAPIVNPIMQPIFDPTQQQQQQQPQPSLYPTQQNGFQDLNKTGQFLPPHQQQPPSLQPQQTIMNPIQQPTLNPGLPQQPQILQPQLQQMNYQNFQTDPMHQQQQQQQQQPQRQQPVIPEPPKQKPPLPEEYVYLQTVFEELKKQCINTAGNPQTKRKLEDVTKRLESLYDLLRENRLSPNTLASLNQLVQLIQNGDYANGLGLHTQIVSGPDFAQIANFMPGIKVLLQSAMQLQVYLR